MNRIKYLQTKKLLKELEWVESDYEWRNEIVCEADSEFINKINLFLEDHPDLKNIYDNKVNEQINRNIQRNIEQEIDNCSIPDEEIITVTKSAKVKKLYRDIVKVTHPDVTEQKSLNDYYIQATTYYDMDDKIGIFKICNELNIEYDIEDNEIELIESRINDLKTKISFLENTFSWRWLNIEDDKEKNEILLQYIKMRLC